MSKPLIVTLVVLSSLLVAFPWLVNAYTVQVIISTITYSMLGLAFALSMRVGLPRIDIIAWFGIGGYTTALLMGAGMNFWLSTLISGMVAVSLGFVVFLFTIPRGMLAFFVFCMLCLLIAPNLSYYLRMVPFLRGSGKILPYPTIGSFEISSHRELYYLGLFLLLITVVVCYLLYNSRVGRAWNSIGSSLKLAGSLGIDVVKYRMANVLIGNFLIAVAGSYFVAHYHATAPLIFSLQAGVLAMMYPLIGGITHSLAGPIVGALIATFVPDYFQFAGQYQVIVTSIIVILILMFMPDGILGWLDRRIKPRFYNIFNAKLEDPDHFT
jgi:branched-chain amino acid transport system permease protein